jgi:hypothetical protein
MIRNVLSPSLFSFLVPLLPPSFNDLPFVSIFELPLRIVLWVCRNRSSFSFADSCLQNKFMCSRIQRFWWD